MTIPAAAMPVAEILRRDVPRPEKLPRLKLVWSDDSLRAYLADALSQPYVLRWTRLPGDVVDDTYCPMGLHPLSRTSLLTHSTGFLPGVTDAAVSAFLAWWDSQTSAQAAVDAVWGPKAVQERRSPPP